MTMKCLDLSQKSRSEVLLTNNNNNNNNNNQTFKHCVINNIMINQYA